MAFAVESQFDSVVSVAFAQHPVRDAGINQQVHSAMLEDSGADRFLDILATTDLHHHGFDALLSQQVGEHQAGGASAHDGDLSGDSCACHGFPRFVAYPGLLGSGDESGISVARVS
ncbi:hypothetical protein D3C73_1138640 [compost metagenome]